MENTLSRPGLTRRRIHLVSAALLLAILTFARPVAAQQGIPGREGPTTVGVAAGIYSGDPNGNFRGSISVDHYLGSFVAHVEGLVIPWRARGCSGGFPVGCEEQHYLMRPEIGARFMDRKGRTHPYFGVGLFYVEAGFRQDLRETSGLDVRVVTEIVGGGDGTIAGGTSLNIGYWATVHK